NQYVTNKIHYECEPPHPIPVQVAWTLENPSRRFKGCPIRDKDKKYRVHSFLNLELPSHYYKHLLHDLHEENKALKRMNKMSGVMEDSSKRMPNNLNNQMVKDLKADLTFVKSKLKVYDRLFLAEIIVLSYDRSTSLKSIRFELSSGSSIANMDTTDKDTTDEDSTDKDTTYKNTINEDTIDESYFPKYKGKNV
nr:hypothetical protein [Tanacetum cinerariifolium]